MDNHRVARHVRQPTDVFDKLELDVEACRQLVYKVHSQAAGLPPPYSADIYHAGDEPYPVCMLHWTYPDRPKLMMKCSFWPKGLYWFSSEEGGVESGEDLDSLREKLLELMGAKDSDG